MFLFIMKRSGFLPVSMQKVGSKLQCVSEVQAEMDTETSHAPRQLVCDARRAGRLTWALCFLHSHYASIVCSFRKVYGVSSTYTAPMTYLNVCMCAWPPVSRARKQRENVLVDNKLPIKHAAKKSHAANSSEMRVQFPFTSSRSHGCRKCKRGTHSSSATIEVQGGVA